MTAYQGLYCNSGSPYDGCNDKSSRCYRECYQGSTVTETFLSETQLGTYEDHVEFMDIQEHASGKQE